MENTGISWTDNTFNPWIGCTKVSPGCAHCYAEVMNKRCGGGNWGQGATRRVTSEAYWKNPLKWNRQAKEKGQRLRVFCSSMADVFDDEAPLEVRERLFELIKKTPHLDWQLLTKRPENFLKFLPSDWRLGYENVWLGVTVENCTQAARRIPLLQQVAAAVRFLSCEPLLEDLGSLDLTGIAWMIVGGESGPGARSFEATWAADLLQQCREQRVLPFMKQLGAKPTANGEALNVFKENGRKDGHAGEPARWPVALRQLAVREFPVAVAQ